MWTVFYQPASPRCVFKDAVSSAFLEHVGFIEWRVKEMLGPDVVEEQRTMACAHCHYVLIKADGADSCSKMTHIQN